MNFNILKLVLLLMPGQFCTTSEAATKYINERRFSFETDKKTLSKKHYSCPDGFHPLEIYSKTFFERFRNATSSSDINFTGYDVIRIGGYRENGKLNWMSGVDFKNANTGDHDFWAWNAGEGDCLAVTPEIKWIAISCDVQVSRFCEADYTNEGPFIFHNAFIKAKKLKGKCGNHHRLVELLKVYTFNDLRTIIQRFNIHPDYKVAVGGYSDEDGEVKWYSDRPFTLKDPMFWHKGVIGTDKNKCLGFNGTLEDKKLELFPCDWEVQSICETDELELYFPGKPFAVFTSKDKQNCPYGMQRAELDTEEKIRKVSDLLETYKVKQDVDLLLAGEFEGDWKWYSGKYIDEKLWLKDEPNSHHTRKYNLLSEHSQHNSIRVHLGENQVIKQIKCIDRLSETFCYKGDNYGFTETHLWVDHGCGCVFEVWAKPPFYKEKCVAIRNSKDKIGLNDIDCSKEYGFVCEKESSDVPHTTMTITPTQSAIKGDHRTIACSVQGYPPSSLNLTRERTGEVLASDTSEKKIKHLTHKMTSVRCLDTDFYVCTAENDQGRTVKKMRLFVQCPPFLYDEGKAPSVINASLGEDMEVSFEVAGFPLPVFIVVTATATGKDLTGLRNHDAHFVPTQFPVVKAKIFIQGITDEDYRNYTVGVYNTIGDVLFHTFELRKV